MKEWRDPTTDDFCDALLSLKTREEMYAFLGDVCTIREVLDLSSRLKVARMLRAGVSYANISKETGASTATISRVSRCLEYGEGGYDIILGRIGGYKKEEKETNGVN